MKTLKLLVALMALATASSVMAEGRFTSAGKVYGGASVGTMEGDLKEACDALDKDCMGWKVFGGYQFAPNFAVEGGYYKLADLSESDNAGTTMKFQASGVAITGVASMPVAPKIDLFGKLGMMQWDAKAKLNGKTFDKDDGTDAMAGVGLNYKITDTLGIRGEYEHIDGDVGSDMLSAGATFSTL